jgi:hypothetical protein
MPVELSIYACDTEAKADEAVAYLIARDYPAANVSKEETSVATYDARRWDGGEFDQTLDNWVVIGRK